MKKLLLTTVVAMATAAASAQTVTATIHADQGKYKINREIYGQFSEHLDL